MLKQYSDYLVVIMAHVIAWYSHVFLCSLLYRKLFEVL